MNDSQAVNNPQVWRVIIDSEPSDAYTNMAVDEALLEGQIRGGSPPTIRFYSWDPPAISLGYAQRIETIDLESCRRSGVGVVRRITGGRAILHDGDFTYSIASREDNPAVQGTLMDTYRKISAALLAGLQQLGVQAALAPGERDAGGGDGPAGAGRRPLEAGGAAACFAASSRYELTVHGRKIIGSAQRRKQGAVLQQGSLPLQDVSRRLFSLLLFSDPEQRVLALERYRSKATSLSEVLGRPVTFSEVAPVFLAGMRDAFQAGTAPGCLDPHEAAEAEQLRRSKYASEIFLNTGKLDPQ